MELESGRRRILLESRRRDVQDGSTSHGQYHSFPLGSRQLGEDRSRFSKPMLTRLDTDAATLWRGN